LLASRIPFVVVSIRLVCDPLHASSNPLKHAQCQQHSDPCEQQERGINRQCNIVVGHLEDEDDGFEENSDEDPSP
jgi:hypothetical protein